jgi:hypothetical protein
MGQSSQARNYQTTAFAEEYTDKVSNKIKKDNMWKEPCVCSIMEKDGDRSIII